ncbi:Sulfotransferase (fragment) [Nostocoides japonicum T1-X7]|uniref:Sulfotransferase n=2 Tax=Nostocoides japonicum TaxID=99481 RepID=A0A077M507_9MICO
MREDLRYESHSHRHHAYRHRGQYVEQLERAYQYFPRNQVHVMESEAFFAHPEAEYRRLLEFLDLEPYVPRRFDQHNARPSMPMPGDSRSRLEEHFSAYDAQLAELLGRAPAWQTLR